MTDRHVAWTPIPPEYPPTSTPTQYPSLVALMDEAFHQYAPRVAYSFMGRDITFAETEALSRALAAYLQGLGLSQRATGWPS